MKKFVSIISFLSLIVISFPSFAQNVRETQISYLKQNVNGYVGEYKVSKSDMEKITENYFANAIKGKRLKNKNFYQFKGVNWNVISLDKADVYYRVDGNKSTSTLTILVSKGYDNYISSSSDAQLSNELKAFFSDFNKEIDKYTLNQRIEEQKKLIQKLEKDHKDLLQEETRMKNKISDLEKDIQSNKNKYENKMAEIEKNKTILQELEKQK